MKKLKKVQNTISYVCSKCGVKEEIPNNVLEYFDEINPEQLLFGEHNFSCEKCTNGIMKPVEKTEILVRGFGIFEGLDGFKSYER